MKYKKFDLMWLLVGIIVALIFGLLLTTKLSLKAEAKPCKSENAECNVNDSNKLCCPGLVCMDKGVPSDNGKCQVAPTATPTPSPSPSPSPTPKPPKDYCKNFEKDQKEIPYGMESVEGYCDCKDGFHRVEEVLELRTLKKEYDTFTCEMDEPEVTPTPEVTPEPTPVPCKENCGSAPTFLGSTTLPPVCSDGNTTKLVANFHVIRAGDKATVNFFITEGNSANIFYKEAGQSGWTHSVMDVKPNSDNFVSYTVNNLVPLLGYDFGAQQKIGCAGGQIATSVVVDDPAPKTFGFSYWIW